MNVPDIVPISLPDDELRDLYGADADAIIAFRRFLALPRNETGQVLCPPHWHEWATGKIDAAEALRRDQEDKQR